MPGGSPTPTSTSTDAPTPSTPTSTPTAGPTSDPTPITGPSTAPQPTAPQPTPTPNGQLAAPTTEPTPTDEPGPAPQPYQKPKPVVPVAQPYVAGGTGSNSLLVDYGYTLDLGQKFSVVADAVNDLRSSAVGALGDASSSAGFPGLGTAIAAFGDVANSKISIAAGDIKALSGTIGQFASTVKTADRSLSNGAWLNQYIDSLSGG